MNTLIVVLLVIITILVISLLILSGKLSAMKSIITNKDSEIESKESQLAATRTRLHRTEDKLMSCDLINRQELLDNISTSNSEIIRLQLMINRRDLKSSLLRKLLIDNKIAQPDYVDMLKSIGVPLTPDEAFEKQTDACNLSDLSMSALFTNEPNVISRKKAVNQQANATNVEHLKFKLDEYNKQLHACSVEISILKDKLIGTTNELLAERSKSSELEAKVTTLADALCSTSAQMGELQQKFDVLSNNSNTK